MAEQNRFAEVQRRRGRPGLLMHQASLYFKASVWGSYNIILLQSPEELLDPQISGANFSTSPR
jgi:hypothetical protein